MNDLFSMLYLDPSILPLPTYDVTFETVNPTIIPKVVFHFLISKALIDHLCENVEEIQPDDAIGVSLEITEEEAFFIVSFSSALDTGIEIEVEKEEILEWIEPYIMGLYNTTFESLMAKAKAEAETSWQE